MSARPQRSILVLAILLIAVMAGLAWWITAPPPSAVEVPPQGAPVRPELPPPELERSAREPVAAGPHDTGIPTSSPSVKARPKGPDTIRAEIADRISGVVVHRDGRPAREGTLVFAGDPGENPPGRSDAEGRFVLVGLAPGRSYPLAAAGHGFLTIPGSGPVIAGTTDAEVEVALLYGISVVLREAGGEPLRSEIAQEDPTAGANGRATPVPVSPLLDFAGADLSPYTNGPGRQLFLYTASAVPEPATIDRVPLRFRYLGYEPADVGLDALPILPAIPERQVELRSASAQFGEIEVLFDGGSDPTIDGPRVHPFRLRIASSAGPHADIPLPRNDGPKILAGIPCANYRYSVLNALDQQIHPRQGGPTRPLRVGTEPVLVEVALEGTAELGLAIRHADDRPYQGRATFLVARGQPSADGKSLVGPTAVVVFDTAPYRLAALLPGHYAIWLREPAHPSMEPAEAAAMFELGPGATRTVTFALP